MHILSGRMTVTPDGGEPTEIRPGDTAVFPRGWAGTWQIHETIRNIYVLFWRRRALHLLKWHVVMLKWPK